MSIIPVFGILVMLAAYGTALIAIVIFVQAIVRISHSFAAISSSLEEIASAMRAGTRV